MITGFFYDHPVEQMIYKTTKVKNYKVNHKKQWVHAKDNINW